MRAILPALLILLLGACLPGFEGEAAPEADTITVTSLDADGAAAPALDAGAETEAAAEAEAAPPEAPEAVAAPTAPPEPPAVAPPPILAAETRACAARGGTLQPRGEGGLWVCVRSTRDAGRACTNATQCEGLCLARSGTCAPIEPLFGCHEVFDRAGRRETLCRE